MMSFSQIVFEFPDPQQQVLFCHVEVEFPCKELFFRRTKVRKEELQTEVHTFNVAPIKTHVWCIL